MKGLTKLTLFFFGFGALAGCASGVISVLQKATSYSIYIPILLAILFLYAAYKSAIPALKILIEQIPEDDRKKIRGRRLVWYGFPPFIIMWFILWIAVYTAVL